MHLNSIKSSSKNYHILVKTFKTALKYSTFIIAELQFKRRSGRKKISTQRGFFLFQFSSHCACNKKAIISRVAYLPHIPNYFLATNQMELRVLTSFYYFMESNTRFNMEHKTFYLKSRCCSVKLWNCLEVKPQFSHMNERR